MGITDKVAQLLEAEIEKKTYEQLCSIVEKVSQLYSVPLKIARRDLLGDTYCMGVKKDGKLCTNKAVREGYCLQHVNCSRPYKTIVVGNGVRHNHLHPGPPKDGCPACTTTTTSENKHQFRDLSTIM
jgi:hypothetical protein